MSTMKLTVEVPEPPAGYVYTGEFRLPESGDWILVYGGVTEDKPLPHQVSCPAMFHPQHARMILKPDLVEQERPAFEKWAQQEKYPTTRERLSPQYDDHQTHSAWKAWLAAKGL